MNELTQLRRRMLEVAHAAQEGHLPSSFSVLEILWVLYSRVLGTTRENWCEPDANRFILSKGHAALALYAVLEQRGFITSNELDTFCLRGSRLGGHVSMDVPGIEHPTGSLGHGLAVACGIAHALKFAGSTATVYCLIGDQEAQEGSVYEAAQLAVQLQLGNLCCIMDSNATSPFAWWKSLFQTLGWHSWLIDGHDVEQLTAHLRSAKSHAAAPFFLEAQTSKGHGCALLEDGRRAWHHRAPDAAELQELLGAVS